MTAPLISVGIPFFNSDRTLLEAIRSIFAQTLQDWELILIDDGSSDRSLEIAHSLCDKRITVIADGENRKLPARLNQIIDLARGKYIARMDSDDMCSVQRLEKQVAILENEPSVDVVGTGICYLSDDAVPLGQWRAPMKHEEICRQPTRMFGLCHASILARKTWYHKNRYRPNALLAEDFDLWFRSYQHSKFANIDTPLYYYRVNHSLKLANQLTSRVTISKFLFNHFRIGGRWDKAIIASFKQYGKLSVTLLLSTLGLRRVLLSRRCAQFTTDEVAIYKKEISEIIATALPNHHRGRLENIPEDMLESEFDN